MANEYSDLVAQKQSENMTSDNPYSSIITGANQNKATSVQQSIYQAQPVDPDRQAKVMKLAQRSGLDPELVDRNFERINQEVNTAENDYSQLVKTNPKISTWLENSNNAKLAKDDLGILKNMEDTVNDTSFAGELFNAFAYGTTNLVSSLAKSPALFSDQSAGLPVGLQDDLYLSERVKENFPEFPRELYENDFTRYLDQAAKGFAPKDIDANIIGEAAGGNYKKAIRAMTFQVASNLPQLGLIAATRGAGLGILGVSSASAKMAENLEAGIAPDVARANALATGLIETGIESIGGVGGASFKSSIKNLVKGLGPDTALDVVKSSVNTIFKNSLTEGAEEFVTSVSQDIVDYGMDVNQDGLEGIWQRAGNSFIVGAGSGGATTAATITPRAAVEAFRTNAKAQQDVATYDQVGALVTESKLQERMPEKQKEVLKDLVQGTPIQDVYMDLDGFETYFQKKGLSPAQAATELGLLDQYNQAKEAGSDIKINYADWTAASVTTEHYAGLRGDIKFSADGMSENQIKAESSAAREQLQAVNEETTGVKKPIAISKIDLTGVDSEEKMLQIFQTRQRAEQYLERSTKRLAEQQQNMDAQEYAYQLAQNQKVEALIPKMKDQPTESEQRNRRNQSVREVRTGITQQLVDAGLSSREAQIQSLVLSEGVGALADAAGISAQELAKQFPLRIQAGTEPVAGALNQQGDEITGQIQMQAKNGTFESIISLFQSRDQSTFAHESAHYLFNVMADIAGRADSSQRIKDDFKGLLDFVGVANTSELTEQHQEKIARAWEAYLMEGKAPTKTLRRAFANFKTWLTAIYKSIQGLENAAGFEINLTPEVRSIFDRMLMSEEQVQLANLRMNYNPLFALAGVSADQQAKYVNALADARIAADDAIRTQLMETETRKQKQFYKEQRASIEATFNEQANAMPVYNAHSIITKGVMADGSPLPTDVESVKINRKSVVDKYGEDTARAFPRGMFSPDGAAVDTVAEMYGFENGTDFVDQFSEFIPKKEYVEAQVNAEMEALYPDMMADPMITEEAVREAHNTDRDRVYRLEMDFLAENAKGVTTDALRRITRKAPSDKVMKDQATKIIGEQIIGEIRPSLYERAEAKQNKLAGELYIKGDILGALEAKRKAALNNYLYKAAKESLESIEKDVKTFKKMFKKDSDLAKSRDVDMVNAGRAILAEFGLAKKDKTPDDYLKPIAQYDPDTYQNLKVLVDQAVAGAQNYENITYDQFFDMSNAVKALWDLSKESREIEIKGKKIDKQQMMDSLINTINETAKPAAKLKYEGSMTGREKFAGWIAGFRASARIVEHWAIAMGGDFKSYIFDPVQEGATKYRVQKNIKVKEYLETFKILNSDSLNGGEIKAPEFGKDVVFKNKAEVLGAILHTGNESNLRKLLVGRGYGMVNEDGSLDTGNWDNFRDRMIREGVLTEQDFNWAQAVWDLNESLKPDAWRAHKKMYGFYPNEVTANEFTVVLNGVPKTYRGGYSPAIADPTRSEKSQTRQERDAMEMNAQNSFMFPTTGRGFTKGRVDAYAVPLSLDINQVAGHIDKVLRFTHIEPNVKFINSIVSDDGFRQELAKVDQAAGKSMLIPWLQRSASQRMSTPLGTDQAWSGIDKIATIVRARTGMQIMGGNVLNALQNYTGLSVSMVLVKPKHLRDSLWDYARNSTLMVDTISDKSDFMKVLLKSDTREVMQAIDDIITTPTTSQKIGEWVNKNAYILQKISQDQVSAITWLGAYNQSIEAGKSDTDAVAEADSIVRQTQSNMTPEGSSRLMAGPPVLQLFVQFFGYFNNLANLNETQFKKIVKESGLRKGAGKLFLLFFLGSWLPAVLSDVIRKGVSGVGFDENDDDEYMDDFISTFLGAPSSFLTAQVPFAGQTLNLVMNRFNDKRYDDRLNLSPTISTIESMAQLPGDVYDAINKKSKERQGIRNVMNTLGIMTGLPGGAVARPLTYLNDIRTGKAEPEGVVDLTRGLISGKPGNKD